MPVFFEILSFDRDGRSLAGLHLQAGEQKSGRSRFTDRDDAFVVKRASLLQRRSSSTLRRSVAAHARKAKSKTSALDNVWAPALSMPRPLAFL